MEITASKVLSHARFSNCSPSSSSSSSFAPSLLSLSDYYKRRPTFIVAANLYQNQNQKQQKKKKSVGFKPRELKKDDGSMVVLRASASESPTPTPTPTPATYTASSDEERWLLQPVGDGDSRHLGSRVEMPGPFEIASNEVTVGRLPEKADMVIPVATGLHARIQKKEGNLLVTDLDSTNGTFVDNQRLRPGVAAAVSSGNCITFGDIHMAMFRAFKLENTEPANEPSEEQTQEKPEADAVI